MGTRAEPVERTIPGPISSGILLTALTVTTSAFAGNAQVDSVLRPLYFAVLFSFFYAIGQRQPSLRVLPFRLIESGFLVLTLGFTAAAMMRGLDLLGSGQFSVVLLTCLERGAVFLLGLTLISFGIISWIPHLLESQRVLRARYAHTRVELVSSEDARSRMEQRFVEADRLHAVGELAAGVAHDLRNPLAIIKAAADSMTRAPREPDELVQHTDVICRNIDRAERTISRLLELGRPHDFSLRVVELSDAIREVCRLVAVECRRRGIRIELAGKPGVTAVADSKLLSQALLNLVMNALQAAAAGTVIRVTCRAFELHGARFCAIAVDDRGEGIATDSRTKLFSPFFTTKPEGTGLGLLSSRRIMDEMGGSIGLFPRTRGGARALMLLPSPAPVLQEVS